MKFLAISKDFSVRKDDIICVERGEEGGCKIHTLITTYDSSFPYESILQLIEMEKIEENISNRVPQQFFAG